MKIFNVAILQRVIPFYRQELFNEINKTNEINLLVLYGEDIPQTKIKSNFNNVSFNHLKHKTSYIKIFKNIFVWHHKLIFSLKKFKPDLIIAEGESNLFSYLQAFFYKLFFKKTKLIHWSYGVLPQSKKKSFFSKLIKSNLLKLFDSYIVYSTYGKKELSKEYGIKKDKIFLALNISRVDKLIELKNDLKKGDEILQLPKGNFTIITSGSLEKEKNFELILEAFERLEKNTFNLIILGDGPYKNDLKKIAHNKKLKNVFFIGKVPWVQIIEYFAISDLFILPGRGGMVISESMACELPVLLKAADGVELDLVKDKETGFYYQENNAYSVAKKISEISLNKKLLKKVSKNAYNLIKNNHSIKNYADSINKAVFKTLK